MRFIKSFSIAFGILLCLIAAIFGVATLAKAWPIIVPMFFIGVTLGSVLLFITVMVHIWLYE